MRRSLLGASLVAALVVGVDATAATLKVPQQHASIQAAVDAAGPGDTVLIKAGVYVENVVISNGQVGLVLKGSGKVVIDARPQGSTGTGPAIGIGEASVTVQNVVVRHARAGLVGAGVVVLANGVTLKNVAAYACDDAGILVAGHDVRIDGCRVIACKNGGIRVTGDRATITGSLVRQCDSAGISVTGSDGFVRKNRVQTIEDDSGIEVHGNGARILQNVVRDTDADAILVTDCGGFEIVGNRVRSAGDSEGIKLAGSGEGYIASNTCEDCFQSGIELASDCGLVIVRKNKVLRCGSESEHGIEIDASDVVVEDNVVTEAESDGLHVEGALVTVRGNKISGCFQDGIEIDGSGCVVDANVVKNCHGEGIQNDAAMTDFTNNVMKGNRTDFVNSINVGVFTGNVFVTGGVMTGPTID